MLLKSEKVAEPHAGALQREVDNLVSILVKPELAVSKSRAQAREKWREAAAELELVKAETSETFRKYPHQYQPERKPAVARLDAAERKRGATQSAFAALKEREEQALIADLQDKIAAAAPVLLDVFSLLHDAVNPAYDLAVHAQQRNITPPTLLGAIYQMHASMRNVTALLNKQVNPQADAQK